MAQVIAEEESVQVDAYLDTLLAGRFAGPRRLRAADEIDPELEATAGLVQRALARFHPSFAFEERLGVRLAAVASGRADADHGPVSEPVLLRRAPLPNLPDDRHTRTGLLRNGAIASGVAGVSIAGAAFLVRRRARPAARQPAEVGV